MDESLFIEQLKQGNGAAFGQLVTQWQDMVYNTALGIVQDEEDAEEIAQDVFLKVHQKMGSFNAQSKLSTWIYRITINLSLDFERKKRSIKRGGFLKRVFGNDVEEEAAHFYHPGVQLDKKEESALLFAAIKKLPAKQKTAFVLQKLDSQSNKEIAEIMQLSETAVEALLKRARVNLKNDLKLYYEKEYANGK